MKISNKRIAAGVLALAFVFGGVGVPAANEAGLNFDIIAASSASEPFTGDCGKSYNDHVSFKLELVSDSEAKEFGLDSIDFLGN